MFTVGRSGVTYPYIKRQDLLEGGTAGPWVYEEGF